MFRILFLGLVFVCVAPFFIKGDDSKPLLTPEKAIGWGVAHVPKAWMEKASQQLGVKLQSYAGSASRGGASVSSSGGWSDEQLKQTLGAMASLQKMAAANGVDLQKLMSQNSAAVQQLANQQGGDLQKLMAEHGGDIQRLMSEHGAQIQQMLKQNGGDLQKLASEHAADIQQALQNPASAQQMVEAHKREIRAAAGK